MSKYEFDPAFLFSIYDNDPFLHGISHFSLTIKPQAYINYNIDTHPENFDLVHGNVLNTLSYLASLVKIYKEKPKINVGFHYYLFANLKTIKKIRAYGATIDWQDWIYHTALANEIVPIEIEDDVIMYCKSSKLIVLTENYNITCKHQVDLILDDCDIFKYKIKYE